MDHGILIELESKSDYSTLCQHKRLMCNHADVYIFPITVIAVVTVVCDTEKDETSEP